MLWAKKPGQFNHKTLLVFLKQLRREDHPHVFVTWFKYFRLDLCHESAATTALGHRLAASLLVRLRVTVSCLRGRKTLKFPKFLQEKSWTSCQGPSKESLRIRVSTDERTSEVHTQWIHFPERMIKRMIKKIDTRTHVPANLSPSVNRCIF